MEPKLELTIGSISRETIEGLIQLQERQNSHADWLDVSSVELTDLEQQQVNLVQSRLIDEPTHLMNEATIWARGIYPLLVLAERGSLRAWAQVPLRAQYDRFSISGVADGVLGYGATGRAAVPYLVVLEAKRGIGAEDPIPQLYGELLAGAYMNQRVDRRDTQSLYGCYTVADSWTFVHATVAEIAGEQPTLESEFSREFAGRLEADTIVRILKRIVAEKSEDRTSPPFSRGNS